VNEIQVDQVLDCRGLSCPLPVIKTFKVINELRGGEILKIMTTDPGSINDFNAWSRQTGNPIVQQSEDPSIGEFLFFVQKKVN